MKNFKRFFIALVAILMVGTTADAQFRWGLKAGLNINKMTTDTKELSNLIKDNTGYQFGITTEFTVPLVGIGMDASIMYCHRKLQVESNTANVTDLTNVNRNYLDIPIHLRYKLGLPVIGKIISPFVFVGPDFAVNFNAKDVQSLYTEKKFDTFLDLGFGLELVSHLQISANYSLGLNKAFEYVGIGTNPGGSAKIKGWTISAAYLF